MLENHETVTIAKVIPASSSSERDPPRRYVHRVTGVCGLQVFELVLVRDASLPPVDPVVLSLVARVLR
jgi:hypothetical protein